MRRRSFIATLPIAASTPALSKDASPAKVAGTGWARLEAEPVTDLGAAPSAYVMVLGSGEIRSFGPAPEGTSKTVRFGGEVSLVHDPARMFLPNNGRNLFATAGDVLTAVSQGGGAWVVTAFQPATVFAKTDRRPSQGGGRWMLAVGADAHTAFPDFSVDGAYGRVKATAKSLILGDPADTTEIGAIAATGTVESPQPWQGYCPHHINYSYAPYIPLDATGGADAATYNGRFAQEYFFQLETPTPKARGGGIAWGVTMPGQIVPYDRMWLRNYGLVLPGRAAFEDSGFRFGYNYGAGPGGAQANFHHIFAPGPVNWGDVAGWGNLSLVASDETTGCAVIAIRANGALGDGCDWMYSLPAKELRLHSVHGGVRTPRWGVPAETGHLLPAAARTVDLGSAERPVRTVHTDTLDVRRAGKGPVAYFESTRPDFSGDLISLSAAGTDRPGFNFIRAMSRGGGSEEPALLIDGAGQAATGGAWTGAGAGAGEYMEWADGNPAGEDRIGWAVVLEAGRIRRAGPEDPAEAVIGVVTARANVVGNAAWSHWSGKYLTDDFGRPLTRPVAYLRWAEPVTETRHVERVRTVCETVRRPRRETVEVAQHSPRVEKVGDLWVQRAGEARRTFDRPVTQTAPLFCEDGAPALDACGAPRTAEIPVFEEVEVERTETWMEPVEMEVGQVEHCHPAAALPAGVRPPPHAERFTVQEKVLNPDFDPAAPYASRRERPEWDVVSFCGQERVRVGERVGDRWIRLRQVSPTVEEWLVR